MAPESGSSSPAIILSSVVLPAPFGPHRPTRSRGVICHVTWSSRTRSPYDFVSSDSWIMPWQPLLGGGVSLFAECLGGRREDLRHAERFREVTGDAEVHRVDGARFGGDTR